MDKKDRGVSPLAILPEDFEGRWVRRARHDSEWWFAVEDVAAALTDEPEFAGACAVINDRPDDQDDAQGGDSGDAARTAARIVGKAKKRLKKETGKRLDSRKFFDGEQDEQGEIAVQ